jgi:hypothetical protein
MAPLEERPEYPYQNIRTKNFFWGDGDKASEPYDNLYLIANSVFQTLL